MKRGGWYQALATGKLLKEDTAGLVISVMESHMVSICAKTCRLSWQLVGMATGGSDASPRKPWICCTVTVGYNWKGEFLQNSSTAVDLRI